MSKITEHIVYKALWEGREVMPFDVGMEKSHSVCFIDATSGANQREKSLFKYNKGQFDAVASNSSFRPNLSYAERRAIPFNLRYLVKKGIKKDQLEHFLHQYFDEETQKYFSNEYYPTQYDIMHDSVSNNHIADAISYVKLDKDTTKFQLNPNKRERKTMLDTLVRKNKNAVSTTINVIAAQTVSTLVIDKVTPLLPESVRPFAQTPLGSLVFANIAALALDAGQDNIDNGTYRKLVRLTDAMLVSSMTALVGQVDIPGLLKGILNTPGLDELVNVVDEQD